MVTENTVLIVDDEESIHQLYSSFLKDLGYVPYNAYDVTDARELLEKYKPEFVLLDVSLPSGSGFDLCLEIKENESTKGTYVLLLTGMGDQEYRLRGIEVGADDFITKPSSINYIKRALNKLKRKNSD